MGEDETVSRLSPPRWRRALVTGASAGIGNAFARELAGGGCDLVLVARGRDRLSILAGDLVARHGVEAEVLVADLGRPEQLATVEGRLLDSDRPVDLLVNNAGGQAAIRRFVDEDGDAAGSVAMVNAFAVHRLTHAALVAMTSRGWGHVVQVSAGVAFYPVPGAATYAASKAFVTSFSEAVDRELAGTGVGVTVVCPGFTRTAAPGRLGFTEGPVPRLLWADAEQVVAAALRGAARRRSVVSPRLVDAAGAAALRHLPRSLTVRLADQLGRSRSRSGATTAGPGRAHRQPGEHGRRPRPDSG
jgi:short-subunit dehydrogenase